MRQVDRAAQTKALEAIMNDHVSHDHNSGLTREQTRRGNACAYMAQMEEVQGPDFMPGWRYSDVVPDGESKSRREIWQANERAYEEANWHEHTCTQSACVFCGLYKDTPGTYSWDGSNPAKMWIVTKNTPS